MPSGTRLNVATVFASRSELVGAPDAQTDLNLLARFARHQDQLAFRQLMRRHGPMVLGVCRRVLRHEQDAEDAFQATFLVLARKAASVRWHGSVGGWLHATARRVALDCRGRRQRRRCEEQMSDKALPRRCGEGALPEVAWRELCAAIDEELGRLPERERAPLVLCYLEGLTVDQAADRLGWPRGTVATRLARGRERLRLRLGRRGIGVGAAVLAALPAVTRGAVPAALEASLAKAVAVAATAHSATGAGAAGGFLAHSFTKARAVPMALSIKQWLAAAAVTLLVAAGVLATQAGDADEPRDPEVRQVRDALLAEVKKLQSVYVRYSAKLEPNVEPRFLTQWQMAGGPVDDEYELAFLGERRYVARYRNRVKLFDGSVLTPEAAAIWFNGRRTRMKQSDADRDLADDKAADVPPDFAESWLRPNLMMYFCAAGRCPPNPAASNDEEKRRHEFWSLPDALAGGRYRPAGLEKVGGVDCTVVVGTVDAAPRALGLPFPVVDGGPVLDKLCLDRARGWALISRELRRRDGSLVARYTNADLKEVAPGVWLPMKSTEQFGTPATAPDELRDRPAFTRHIKVSKVTANATPPDFFEAPRE